jgi:hypothetical protein
MCALRGSNSPAHRKLRIARTVGSCAAIPDSECLRKRETVTKPQISDPISSMRDLDPENSIQIRRNTIFGPASFPISQCNGVFWRTSLKMTIASLFVVNCFSSGVVYAPSQMSLSSPVYANAFEIWGSPGQIRHSTSPVTFRVQCETRYGWEVFSLQLLARPVFLTSLQVCVAGGCESLGYWDPRRALLLRTDPSRYPIWEVSESLSHSHLPCFLCALVENTLVLLGSCCFCRRLNSGLVRCDRA